MPIIEPARSQRDANGVRSRARRRFLASSVRTAVGASLFGSGVALYSRSAESLPVQAIRPPGAGSESEFLGACIRCGLCVRDCPWDALRLSELGDQVAVGTPYFVARQKPCEMCEDIPCVVACPTGALDKSLTDIDAARMGLAVLIDQETCLNMQGLRCDVCYRACPLIETAITLVPQRNRQGSAHTLFAPTVHSSSCTGCGKCEEVCVLDEAAIKVVPIALAKGAAGKHYRFGWEEKAKAGRALIPGVIDLPDRLPAPGGGG